MNDKKYSSSWDAEVMKRIVELERERDAARAAGYAEAIEIVKGYYAIGEHAIIARLRAAATTKEPK